MKVTKSTVFLPCLESRSTTRFQVAPTTWDLKPEKPQGLLQERSILRVGSACSCCCQGNRPASLESNHERRGSSARPPFSVSNWWNASQSEEVGGAGAGLAVSWARRSRGLASWLPGRGACRERSASSVVSVAGCLQLGKPRQLQLPPSSSAPVRWPLFLFVSPRAASVRLRWGRAGCASPAVSYGGSAGPRGWLGFVRAGPSHWRAARELGSAGLGQAPEEGLRAAAPRSLGSSGATKLQFPPLGSAAAFVLMSADWMDSFSSHSSAHLWCAFFLRWPAGGFEFDNPSGPIVEMGMFKAGRWAFLFVLK